MRRFIFAILMTSSAFAWADDVCVSSPSDKLKVNVSDAGGRLYYSVTFDGQEVLQPSALGLKTSVGDFTKGLSIVDTQNSTISESYLMRLLVVRITSVFIFPLYYISGTRILFR